MNFRHALGFFAMGAVFALMPRVAPEWCVGSGLGGSEARVLWLQIMSVLLLGLGLSYFGHRTLIGLASLLEFPPRAYVETLTRVSTPRPAFSVRPSVTGNPITPISAALESGLLDQQRAA